MHFLRRATLALALALPVAAGCSGEVGDAPPSDAPGGDGGDAQGPDGGPAFDGGDTSFGGGDADDAEVYVGGAECTVDGVLGECIDVSLCTGELVPTPGHCAGPANIQCCTVRRGDAGVDAPPPDASAGWCPTDPTARPNASRIEGPGALGCPKGMLRIPASSALPAFCVDEYEGAIVVTNPDGSESSWTPYYPPPTDRPYRAVSMAGAVPQGYISGEESQIACKASGKRLCDNAEWLRACQGPTKTTYPYGNTRVDGRCNDHRAVHPAVQCFGTSASWIYSELGYAGINQQADTVALTGSYPGCVTAEGAFDMMGNLHEWIYDDPSKYADPVKAIDFRGGFYTDTKLNGEGCLYQTTAHTFGHWDYSTGFRCCADAK